MIYVSLLKVQTRRKMRRVEIATRFATRWTRENFETKSSVFERRKVGKFRRKLDVLRDPSYRRATWSLAISQQRD